MWFLLCESSSMTENEQLEVVFDKEYRDKKKPGLFQNRSFTFVGVGIFLFFLIVGVLAPNLTGPDALIPYNPNAINLDAQYLPPFSYESEAVTGIFPIGNPSTAPNERTVAGIIHAESVEFINGSGITSYKQISQINRINDSGTERWADISNPGTFNGTTGEIQLTDETINREMNVSYRIGGKIAFQIKAGSENIRQIAVKLRFAVESQYSLWEGSLQMYIYDIDGLRDDGVISDVEPLGVSNEIEGKTIITGGTTKPRLKYFTFSTNDISLNQDYWVVLDTDIENVIDQQNTQTLIISVDIPGRPFEDLYQKGWNAESGWNVGTAVLSGEGIVPYFVVYKQTDLYHLMGTDGLGRDILASIVWGVQTTLIVAFLAVSVEILIGSLLGFIFHALFQRETLEAIPNMSYGFPIPYFFLLIIMFIVWEQMNILIFAFTIGCLNWSRLARIGRKPNFQTMEVAIGNIADIIIIESFLSFIGFGIPMNSSLGAMVRWGMMGRTLITAGWVVIIPGIIITLLIFSFNLIKQGLNGKRITQTNPGSEFINEDIDRKKDSKSLKSDSGNISDNYGKYLDTEFLFQLLILPIIIFTLIFMDIFPIIPDRVKLVAIVILIGLPWYVYRDQKVSISQDYFYLSTIVFLGGALLLFSVTLV